jgi:hypothetical protein
MCEQYAFIFLPQVLMLKGTQDNILIDGKGNARLSDFGMSKMLQEVSRKAIYQTDYWQLSFQYRLVAGRLQHQDSTHGGLHQNY